HRRHHPLAPVPTRREYQELRTLHQETRSHSRCC
ncbi:CstA-like transporter-associated (seleno)protein, partial [Streptomyces sp. NPDC006356]